MPFFRSVSALALAGGLALGAAVAIALVVNTVVAGLFGTAIPIVLKRLRIDPAIASSVARTRMSRALVSPGVFAKVICGVPITDPSRRSERRAVISARSNRPRPSGTVQQAASAG